MSGTPVQSASSMSYPPNDGGGATETQTMHQTPAFFLANYRLGKTLGNGSFGKVFLVALQHVKTSCNPRRHFDRFTDVQVKIAEHVLTQHKVAIKILNKRKIKQQDMEEKGMALL